MNRTTAHLILAACDVAALYACYFVFSEWQSLIKQISLNVQSITFQDNFFAYGLMPIVPVVHFMSLVKWQGFFKKLANSFLIFVFFVILITVFGLNKNLKSRLEREGYRYCPSQSEQMTFSEFKTYFSSERQCIE